MTSFIYSMNKNITSRICFKKTLPLLTHRYCINYSESAGGTATEESILPPTSENEPMPEEILEKKRNISRLPSGYRGVLYGKSPFEEKPKIPKLTNLETQRSLYGKYGDNSGVNPGICFITEEEMEDLNEYEKVAYTEPILEIRKRKLEELAEFKKQCRIREEHYDKMLASVDAYKQRLREKIQQKMSEAEAAQKKREALMEEVKRHFGYTISPKDERFQLMLEQKEKEQKKLKKEMKKKKREEYFMAKLAALETGQESQDKKSDKKSTKNENIDDEESKDEDENVDKKE